MTPTSELAHPDTPYRILPHDDAPSLPDGHGAVAMRVWCPRASVRFTTAPVVTVDGKPAVYGWGSALIVVPAGAHAVAVPGREVSVTVAAGEVVRLECAASYDGTAPASLGPPGQRPAGRLPRGVPVLAALGLGMFTGVVVMVALLSADLPAAGPIGLFAGIAVGATVFATARHRARLPSST